MSAAFSAFADPLRVSWSRRSMLAQTVRIALRQRYAGTAFGLAWLVLGPVLLLAIYSAVYLVVFRIRPANMEAGVYVLYIFSGLIPLINFSQGLTQGAVSLTANRSILLSTVFPPELVPLREVLTSLITTSIAIMLVLAAALVMGKVAWTWLLVPVVLMLLMMFLAGLTWILSLANLVLKDIQQALTYVTIILLVASPIAYTPDMLPDALRVLLYFNPLAYYIVSLQSLIVLGSLPHWPIALGALGFSVASLLLGAYVFSRAKTVFFDYA
ncbi:ABC transporter permease [Pelagibius marinus]|uniref:ABC transporter permease n=1 Tax=Pelagibius marinus TaxID=2762760 RepID=UPI0018730975|nr:ABC transporter permease [Pelagibius marinus]